MKANSLIKMIRIAKQTSIDFVNVARRPKPKMNNKEHYTLGLNWSSFNIKTNMTKDKKSAAIIGPLVNPCPR